MAAVTCVIGDEQYGTYLFVDCGLASGELDRLPGDALGVQYRRKDTLGRLRRQEHGGPQHHRRCRRFEVQEIEPRVPLGELGHAGDGRTWVRQADVVTQCKKTSDGRPLVRVVEVRERARELTTCTDDCGATGPEIPIRGRVELPRSVEPGEQLLNQKSIIKKECRALVSHLLIDEVSVFNPSNPSLVAASEHAVEFLAGAVHATRQDQSCVAQVDDADLAAVIDAPPVAEFCRQVRLAPMRHSRG